MNTQISKKVLLSVDSGVIAHQNKTHRHSGPRQGELRSKGRQPGLAGIQKRHYDSIDSGERFQVKRITVKPGEQLSVQMHHHRAEHWVVVSGTAKVQRDEEHLTLSENESVYLPIGCVHALENPGKIPLELIEVQSGSYLGEDDIVRFDDKYGREKVST